MDNNPTYSIELKDVSLFFDDSQPALKNINLAIQPGEFVGIIGGPGSGKSTLLNLMAGVIPHYQVADIKGQALLNGIDTLELNLAKIATHIGMVTQDPENQLFNLLVKDEIVWALENRGYEQEDMEDRLVETLAFFNISKLRDRITYDLSGGEKQRVALASTHIFQPDILMLDNPTSQLDPVGSNMVIESIKKILAQHQTVIMVEDKIDELLEHADRLVFLHAGQIVLDVKPDALSEHVEQLHEIGVRPPEVIELSHRLRRNGIQLNRIPIGLSDAVALYQEHLNGHRPSDDLFERDENTIKKPSDHLVISNLSFTYPPPRTIQALKSVDLSIEPGSFVAIIGRNGSGKTTLARCISGYLKPTTGQVTIGGIDTHRLKLEQRVKKVGYVFQNPDHQIFKDSVKTDVEFGPQNMGWSPEEVAKRTGHVLEMLRLDQYGETHPYMLSKGNRQRLAIAAIAAMTPEILIIDEPTTGQDPVHARQVMDLLASLQQEGITIIVVTHAMHLVGEYCDRVIAMNEGEVLIDGSPRDVFAHPELLEKTSVVPPPVAQLSLELGITPPPLTIEDATDLFTAILSTHAQE